MRKSKSKIAGMTLIELLVALAVITAAGMMVLPTLLEEMREGREFTVVLIWTFAVVMVVLSVFVWAVGASRSEFWARRVLVLSAWFAVSGWIAWLLPGVSLALGSAAFWFGLISPFYQRHPHQPLWQVMIGFALLVFFAHVLSWSGWLGIFNMEIRWVPVVLAAQVLTIASALRWWDALRSVDLPCEGELNPYSLPSGKGQIYLDSGE